MTKRCYPLALFAIVACHHAPIDSTLVSYCEPAAAVALTPPNTNSALTASEFVTQLGNILCGADAQACCTSEGSGFSTNGCLRGAAPSLPSHPFATLNPNAAQATLDDAALMVKNCGTNTNQFNADYAAAWTGTVVLGGNCTFYYDCEPAASGNRVFCDNICIEFVPVADGADCSRLPTPAQPSAPVCGSSSLCGREGFCLPYVALHEGEGCSGDDVYCDSGLFCNDNKVCQRLGAPGEACPTIFGGELGKVPQCDGYCGANDKCVAYAACGSACTASEQCSGGEACDPMTHKCDGWGSYGGEFTCTGTLP
jgi:hypothetical protein